MSGDDLQASPSSILAGYLLLLGVLNQMMQNLPQHGLPDFESGHT
jgi:hypothetical protein